LVSGHVDGIGLIKTKEKQGNAILVTVTVPEALTRYMIHKGSVAIDGVSLTINACDTNSFKVSIIPHTADITTVGLKQRGDAVNIETDMIGKFVEQFTRGKAAQDGEKTAVSSAIDKEFLAKAGYL
jgi:riboflavin synthase